MIAVNNQRWKYNEKLQFSGREYKPRANEQVIVQVSISSLEFYFPLCHDIFPFSFFPWFHALSYLLTTHFLHSSTQNDLKNCYEQLSPYILRLLISSADLFLHLTHLNLLWACPFLVLSLPQKSHLRQSLSSLCKPRSDLQSKQSSVNHPLPCPTHNQGTFGKSWG